MSPRHYFTRVGISLLLSAVLMLLLMVWLAWKTDLLSTEVGSFFRIMSLGTASCIGLLTIVLFIKLFYSYFITTWLCRLVMLFAFLRVVDLYTASDYLDRIVIALWGISLNHKDGAMSYLTSICLFLLAVALNLSADKKTSRPELKYLLSLSLTFCVIFLVTIALSGYLLQLKAAFTWMGMRMALHTAIVLFIISVGIFILNSYWALEKLYQLKVIQRFFWGLFLTFTLGTVIFIVVQKQINYSQMVSNELFEKLKDGQRFQLIDVEDIKRTEHEIKQVILILTMGFVVVCMFLFSGIFISLNHQLRKLQTIILWSTKRNNVDDIPIPYINNDNEFGFIARSIESFIKLNQSERRLQSKLEGIVEFMPNGIIIVNREGKIELVNQAICKMFGYESEELMGKPLKSLLPSSVVDKHPEYLANYFAEPRVLFIGMGRELFGIAKDGRQVALEIGLAPIESDQGIQILASVVDITERKLTEKNLATSREKIEVTSRSLEIGIWEYLPAENKLLWDETMFLLYEADPENFNGVYEEWRSRVHPDDIAEQEMKFLYAMKTGAEFTGKFRIVTKHQGIKYIQAKAKVERNQKNQSIRIIGTNFDITREEMGLKKIQQLDNLRVAIVEQSDDAIISKTPEGIVTSWNKGAEKMFGFQAYEVIGKNIKNLVVPLEKYQEHDQLLSRVLSGEHISHYLTQSLNKDGILIDVSINFSPIRDEKGNVISISSIKRDVSESIKAAKTLSNHQKELERSNKSLETFAYVASHDLKAPLRGITQLTTWLEEDIREKKFSAVTTTTEKIKVRIKRMEALLDDLLAYYRIEKMQGFYKELDVAKSVQDLFIMNNTRPHMQLVLSDDLPCFATYVTPFEQVITNLLTNAIKHHDKADGTISVSAKTLDADWFEFCIKDDGPGIDPQFHQRIFNMFQTLKPRDEVEGSGMGLALVKKIVEQYGGQVRVESQSRGAAFYFTWPATIKREMH